ncbi:hypothetical protein ACQCSU_21525 [Pseudarthrobacter sp. O4]|uniref:hypothetical protein n=1 Tax=Pseudarthrobacter sp. O4 TaxID=3418417 RepID=UPI003CFBBC2C
MNPIPRIVSSPVLSRRQFGLVVVGGAFLLVAGGTYGVISRSLPGNGTGLATAFGALSVVKAGRLTRLDAQGRPASKSLSAAVAQVSAGAGAVAAAASVPRSQREDKAQRASVATHSHDGGELPDSDWPQPGNFTWGDVVVLEVALKNDRQVPVLFGPGQLRLKLIPSGITVTPQDFDRVPGTIAAGATEHVWISYLAPRDAGDMELEYSEPERDGLLSLALPHLTVSQVKS